MPQPIRIAVLLSKSGTSLQNLIDRIANGRLNAQIVAVISNNTEAYGLKRARLANIPALAVLRKEWPSVSEFSTRIFDHCRSAKAELVCLAGFLQLIEVPSDFQGRTMNIHPALIPSFCGKGFYGHHVHETAIAMGVKVSGCTVHFVDNEYDHGPIIMQRTVEVRDDDTADTLASRVFEAECEAYPEAIRLFAQGKLKIVGRRVRVSI
ncbi:MAG: phosphoribosylglycinamide formyltransferase [Gemmataceae bacterium]|nr:phosphoribosylglycinamide formyltransferase [Gemmataceae bacterium]